MHDRIKGFEIKNGSAELTDVLLYIGCSTVFYRTDDFEQLHNNRLIDDVSEHCPA